MEKVIKTAAELLKVFVDQEKKKLDEYKLSHGPTIGSMYEGLTAKVLEQGLPPELNLQVVSGFVCFESKMSGEIDCMLVTNVEEQIPNTIKFKCHVKDVIAVFEVKKTLTGDDLADSYNHLRDVSQLYADYIKSQEAKGITVDLQWPRRAFSQITGMAPEHDNLHELPFDLEMLYHTLVSEFLGPIRIVVGHHGWKKEKALRDHIVNLLEKRLASPVGMGVASFPQLIIGGENSLVKANGIPYARPLVSGMWPFLLSTNHNPLRIMLELIFSKLDFFYGTNLAKGDSIEQEAMSVCLRAKAVRLPDKAGWEYMFDALSAKALRERGSSYLWEPAKITDGQYTVIMRLCQEESVNLEDPHFIESVSDEQGGLDSFVRSLIDTQLVARKGSELVLTTVMCQVVFFGGDCFAGENNAGQLTTWLEYKFGRRFPDSNILIIRGAEGSSNE